MKEAKKFKYINEPTKYEPPYLDKNIDLQKLFEQCNQEMGLQQTKRDQLINFYLTITGFVVAYVFGVKVDEVARILILLALAVIGAVWTSITIRYKVYKDAYWMCCKTITSMFSVNRENIDKPYLQHIFYRVIKKSYESVPQDKNTHKPNFFKFVIKNLSSAEYLMFLTLALLSGIALSASLVCAIIYFKLSELFYLLVILILLAYIFIQTVIYNKAALSVYNVVLDELDSSFNSVYKKSWFLHFFL